MGGFGAADFGLLAEMEAASPSDGAFDSTDRDERIEALWAKTADLVDRLGAALFGAGEFNAALWPDTAADQRFPFLWARLKRAGAERFATHIGLFLSPGHCNLAIDLEKDLLDAGVSGETLDQVLDFCRRELVSSLAGAGRDDLQVWTDTGNVVAASSFPGVDFGEFIAANRDAGHPWPKVGYLLEAGEVVAFGNRWVDATYRRAVALAPVYDAMIRSFNL